MTVVYVSDVLERVLDAGKTRAAVRNHCKVILRGVPQLPETELEDCLHYIAGKCMGYPAIWLVEQALDLNEEDIGSVIDRASGPLFISLTTSVTDDFLDGDERMSPGHMMLVYLLIFEALRRPQWFFGRQEDVFLREVYPLIPGFVNEGKPQPEPQTLARLKRMAQAGERRIGAFHETIAHAMTCDRLSPERCNDLVRLAGKFGDWCAQLDDIFDIEVDIEAGANTTRPIALLQGRHARLARAIAARDVSACGTAIQAEDFQSELIAAARERLLDLRDQSEQAGYKRLSDRLTAASERVEGAIRATRRKIEATRFVPEMAQPMTV
ncbi:hypothetical protein GCM10007385_39730 [Tateyamaria omphalii]|uniref:hypothetical protein n=1 Tax=Tateyamaria omphalii TaxID=299262 RepID=UPI00167A7E66|nr:hypothetical protein [Tateyamaria omphalii]GGX66726.1 hypothetical protein GCM10007385_39730 [Tateyamaria omphalii]